MSFIAMMLLKNAEKRHHRLHRSASSVLMATSQLDGRWQILTPYRIETSQPIVRKFGTINYCERSPQKTKVGTDSSTGEMGEMTFCTTKLAW